jgi:phage terminase large subunit-like protein
MASRAAVPPMRRSVPLGAACRDRALIPLQPHPGQDELLSLAEEYRFLFAACGRRFGKSRWAAATALHNLLLTPEADALVSPGETRFVLIVANSREQALVVLDHARTLVRSSQALAHELVEESEYELRFRGNRSFLALPCSSRSVRGYAASTVIFDEMAHYPDEDVTGPRTADRLWAALTPSVAQFGRYGRVIAISTPAGTSGLFAELWQKARGGELPEAAAYTAPTSKNPLVDPAYLAAQEAALGPDDFDREFNAVFTAGGLGFFEPDRLRAVVGNWKEVLPADGTDWRCAIDPAFARDPFGLAVVGRRRDDGSRLVVGHTQRWLAPKTRRRIIRTRTDETSQIEKVVGEVASVCERYGVTRLISDQHLSGTMQSEFEKIGFTVEIAAWTGDSKTAAMRSLRALINTSRIELPDDPVLIAELGRVRTKLGRDEIETPRTGDSHCDVALSVAAAVLDHERRPPVKPLRLSSGWKARAAEDARRELVSRGLTFRNEGPGIHPPRNGSPGWDQGFRR